MKKDVIYLEAEDDITGIIDKVKAAKLKIVAIVPPKRSTVLQSVVNMKLLKRAADNANKKLVIITNESALLPLAGATGLHVAKDLKTPPAIPEAPAEPTPDSTSLTTSTADGELDKTKPVGELAGDKPEPVEAPVVSSTATPKTTKKTKKSKNTPKIPSFERFRNKLLLALGLLLLLGVGYVIAFMVLPKAEVTIQARATEVSTDLEFTVDTKATEDDLENKVLVGTVSRVTKTLTESFEATGKKNIGQKASGTVTVVNNCFNPGTIPSGTSFSNGSFVFVSTESVSIPDAVPSAGSCSNPTTAEVGVRATQPGDQYNLADRTYSVSGYSRSDVYARGEQMSGGTTEVAKIVTSSDISDATDKLLSKSFGDIKGEVREDLPEGTYAIEATFSKTNKEVAASPKAGTEADNGEVSAEFVFTLVGVQEESLSSLVEEAAKAKVGETSQAVLESGLNESTTQQVSRQGVQRVIKLNAPVRLGPDIDSTALAEEISGKQYGEAKDIVLSKNGVSDAEITLSPFWVFDVPKASRVTVTVELVEQTTE